MNRDELLFSFLENEKQNISKMKTIDIFNLLSKKFNLHDLTTDEREFYIQVISSCKKNFDFMKCVVDL